MIEFFTFDHGWDILQIIFADISMSIDNVLAVAAIARDDIAILIFGLALAIVFMTLCATVTMRARAPSVALVSRPHLSGVPFGAHALGRVAGFRITHRDRGFRMTRSLDTIAASGCFKPGANAGSDNNKRSIECVNMHIAVRPTHYYLTWKMVVAKKR